MTNNIKYRCSQMRRSYVLGLSFLIVLSTTIVARAADDTIRIVTLGDSITKGVRTGVSKEQTFAHLLQVALNKKGIQAQVTNVGIGGERTDQALKRLHKVIALKPHFVTIMYGTNDSYVDQGKKNSRITAAAYTKNLEAILKKLRAAGIVPVLMTEPRWGKQAGNNGAGEHPNVRLAKYVAACRQVALKTKTPLVDHFKLWTAKEQSGIKIGSWTTDQCHPNAAGHQVISEAILPVLIKNLAQKPAAATSP